MKIERVYREILFQLLEKKKNFFSQKKLAEECGISIGSVNHALKPLESMGAIEKKHMGFRVLDAKKMLLYWASVRKLQRDVVYQTHSDAPVEEIEKSMPEVVFTAYSGYKMLFRSVPSDYGEVYVYGDEHIAERFPLKKGKPNVIVLRMDEHLRKFKSVPMAQLFADLWNINTWYAQEFLKALEAKIDEHIKRVLG
ncbi:MAG: winged helix-turn-helix domain-containing protein [Candidatus Aenigmarchaeota archaeon]|nr:winged helix-turn-helix domain-containing protein [Candidatus Aenigmarchaeota archaeon]